MQSLPHFVFLTFGSTDSHQKSFTEEKFVNSYKKLIKDVHNLPTKPMVYLMVPVSNCNDTKQLDVKSKKNQTNLVGSSKNCSAEASKDM